MNGNDPDRAVRSDQGRRLESEYWEMFPEYPAAGGLDGGSDGGSDTNWHKGSDTNWQAAAEHGATLEWALRVIEKPTGTNSRAKSLLVVRALRIGAAVPVDAIDELIGYGWLLAELHSLMARMGTVGFPGTVRRLGDLYRTSTGIYGPDDSLLWYALAAVMCDGFAGLTDLQVLRWLRVVGESPVMFSRFDRAFRLTQNVSGHLREWVAVAGPDGWS